MPELDSTEYYRLREHQERARAMACVDPGIAAIHSEMADRYSGLIGQADVIRRLRQSAPVG